MISTMFGRVVDSAESAFRSGITGKAAITTEMASAAILCRQWPGKSRRQPSCVVVMKWFMMILSYREVVPVRVPPIALCSELRLQVRKKNYGGKVDWVS